MSEQLAEETQVNEEAVVKEDLTTENAEDDQNDVEPTEQEGEPDEEVVITIGEHAPAAEDEEQAQAPSWVKEMRKENRHLKRELKEFKEKSQPKEAKLEVEAEPTLEEFDYDDKKYRDALLSWKDRSDAVKAQAEKIRQEEQNFEQSFHNRVNAYKEAKTKLKGIDFDEAESIVFEMLSATQKGLLIDCAKKPAILMAALSQHTAKTKELAAISNPAHFAAAIGALETELKVTPKKSPPPPESTVSKGSAKNSGAVDSTLEKMRENAKKTGNWTPIHQYNMAKRKK